MSAGLVAFCIWKLCLDRKEVKREEPPPFSGTNHLYYEINESIYETIEEADDELKVKMANNDAYQDIQLTKTNLHYWCVTNVTNKGTIGNTLIQMENNNSYQAITSPVIANSEVSTTCCYETPLVHTQENTPRLNNRYASQEEIMKQDVGRVLPERELTPSSLLHVDSHDMNDDTFCHSSNISPKCMSSQGEHNLQCEEQV